MTASSRTTIPHMVRVDAASPTPWLTAPDASIVHLGHSACVLAAGREQLVITSEEFGLAPGGIQLRTLDLARLRGELASGSSGLAHWRPAVVELVDLRMPQVDTDPVAVAVLAAALGNEQRVGDFDPRRQRSAAAPLVRSALAGDDVGDLLVSLIGAGPGSTPAGDDVVVGVLAGLSATGHAAAAELIARSLPPLLDRTTAASRLYLSAADDGRFAERVHLLIRGLADRSSALAAVRSARRWGATSGLDLLSGVIAAARPSSQMRQTA